MSGFDKVYLVKPTTFGEPVAAFTSRGAAYLMYESLTRDREDTKFEDYVINVPVFMNWATVKLALEEAPGDSVSD